MTTVTHHTETDSRTSSERRMEEPSVRRAGWSAEGNETRRTRDTGGEGLAHALGLFSVGLGLTQILAPRRVARAIGLEDDEHNRKTMLAFGFRETASGIGLLTQPHSPAFAWGRVAGDAMGLAVLGRALVSGRNDHNRVAVAMAAVLSVTILDLMAGRRLSRPQEGTAAEPRRERAIRVKKAITVNRSPEEAYGLWRNFENLPSFMAHLESVRVVDERRSYWKARAPLGATVEWMAEIVEDRPNELIAWRSLEGADVPNSGQVRFAAAPDRRGTEVRVELKYDPPGGAIGATIAKLFGEEPSQQLDGDLRRFKQVLEVGEVVHSDASIHRGLHPARPPAELPRLASTFQGGWAS